MIKFTFQDKNYELEFTRKREEVELVRRHSKGQDCKVKRVESKFPYTTARLWLVSSAGIRVVLANGKVGCAPIDQDVKRVGRRRALQLLSRVLRTSLRDDKPMQQALTAALWDAYRSWELHNQKKEPEIPPSVQSEAPLPEVTVQ